MSLCAICAAHNRLENAHIEPKGMGGRGSKAPASVHATKKLCAGSGGNTDPLSCHGANEAGFLDLDLTADGHLRYCVKEDVGRDSQPVRDAYLRRLRSFGMNVRPGHWYVARHEDTDPDAIDDYSDPEPEPDGFAKLAAGRVTLSELRALVATVSTERELGIVVDFTTRLVAASERKEAASWREKAIATALTRDSLIRVYGDKEGRARWMELREHMRLHKTAVSKMLTVVEHVPEYIGDVDTTELPVVQQYELARAIRDGKRPAEELASLAASLSISDFRSEVWGRPCDATGLEEARTPMKCPAGVTDCKHLN